DVWADFRRGFVQLGLPAAGNKDIGALFHEALGGGEANAAASSRDDGDLSFKSRHCYAPLHLVALRSTISVPTCIFTHLLLGLVVLRRFRNAKGRIMAAGLRWVDGSYLLFVEPRLIGNLDVVSVRVADVCREVVGTPFGSKARFLVGSSSRVHRRLVAGPDSVRALGGECDVKVFGDFAILQPETRIAIDGETALGSLIELVGHVDAKRLKQLLVEFARPFQVRDGEINMVDHGFPPIVD